MKTIVVKIDLVLASCSKLQRGLEFLTLEYRTHWNTQHFEVLISNGSVLEWSAITIAIALVLAIRKPNHWKSGINGGHFVPISDGFGQNNSHFVQK